MERGSTKVVSVDVSKRHSYYNPPYNVDAFCPIQANWIQIILSNYGPTIY